jgi:hypothetical protein
MGAPDQRGHFDAALLGCFGGSKGADGSGLMTGSFCWSCR